MRNTTTYIPISINRNKKLKYISRLLYGDILFICKTKGYCLENNSYFANLYSVSEETISRSISELRNNNYIDVDYSDNDRKIFIR